MKLKKPISVKKGNLNELQLTFQSTTLNDDIVAIKGRFEKGFLLDEFFQPFSMIFVFEKSEGFVKLSFLLSWQVKGFQIYLLFSQDTEVNLNKTKSLMEKQ